MTERKSKEYDVFETETYSKDIAKWDKKLREEAKSNKYDVSEYEDNKLGKMIIIKIPKDEKQ